MNKKENAKIIGYTFAAGIVIYLRLITQWLTNADGVWVGLVAKRDYSWENALGRYGLGYVGKLKGFFVYPALQTVFNLFLVSVAALILFELFEMKKVVWGVLTGLLLVCSPSLCSTLTYYYTSDAYVTAWLLSILFVWILVKCQKIWGIVAAAALLAISLTMYQAYVGTAITLCLLYLLFLVLCKNSEWKRILICAARFAGAGVLGILVYLGSYKVFCMVKGVVPVSDRGFDSMGQIPVGDMGALIGRCYKAFYDYFLTDNLYNNSWHFRGKTNLVAIFILLAVVILAMAFGKLYREIRKMILAVVLLLCIPLAFMSIVIMAPEASVYDVTGILMLPHMNFLFVFLMVVAVSFPGSEKTGVVLQWISAAACCMTVYILVLYTQIFQNCMEMDLHRTYSLAERIVERVEALPEYETGITLLIGGRAENGNYPRPYEEMYYVTQGTAAVYGYMWDSLNGQQNCWIAFLGQYLGVQYSVCSNDMALEIMSSQEYKDMPYFPKDNSIKVINGCVVVKLSD